MQNVGEAEEMVFGEPDKNRSIFLEAFRRKFNLSTESILPKDESREGQSKLSAKLAEKFKSILNL